MVPKRPEHIEYLRRAVAQLKREGWPKKGWRSAVSRAAREIGTQTAAAANTLLSSLDPDEWESLKLPKSAANDRPPNARRRGGKKPALLLAKKPLKELSREEAEAYKDLWMPLFVEFANGLRRDGLRPNFRLIARGTCRSLKRPWPAVEHFLHKHCGEPADLAALGILPESESQPRQRTRDGDLPYR